MGFFFEQTKDPDLAMKFFIQGVKERKITFWHENTIDLHENTIAFTTCVTIQKHRFILFFCV